MIKIQFEQYQALRDLLELAEFGLNSISDDLDDTSNYTEAKELSESIMEVLMSTEGWRK